MRDTVCIQASDYIILLNEGVRAMELDSIMAVRLQLITELKSKADNLSLVVRDCQLESELHQNNVSFLEDRLKSCSKEIRKQKFKKVLLAISGAGAGFATGYILKR